MSRFDKPKPFDIDTDVDEVVDEPQPVSKPSDDLRPIVTRKDGSVGRAE